MTWAIEAHPEANPPFAKWIDREQADRWLRVIENYLSLDVSAWAQPRGDTNRQVANIRLYLKALQGLAFALNLHPCDLAPYSARRLQADPGELDVPGFWSDTQLYRSTWRYAVNGILARRSEVYRAQIADNDDVQVEIFSRLDFDASGNIVDRHDQDPPGAPIHGFGTWSGSSDRIASNQSETDPPSEWLTTVWNEYDAGPTGYIQVIVPLEWTYDLLRAAMADCVRFGLVELTAKSIAWGGVRNSRMSVLFGGDGVPSDVVTIAAAFDTAAVTTPDPPSAWRASVGAMGSLASVLLSTGVGAAVAAATVAITAVVFGVPELLNRLFAAIFGVATARGYDVWGRPQPYLVKQDLTGSLTERAEPTHPVPPAPYVLTAETPEAAPEQVLLNEYGTTQRQGTTTTSGGGALVVVLGALLLLLSRKRR